MKDRILKNWNVRRFIYLAIGLYFTITGIRMLEWTAFIPGLYFASMAIFQFGCAAGNCYIPTKTPNSTSAEPAQALPKFKIPERKA